MAAMTRWCRDSLPGRRRLRRQIVALTAAYALAMQALLMAALVPAAVGGPLAIICGHDGGTGQDDTGRHDLPCAALCAAIGHGVAGPLPANPAVALRPLPTAASYAQGGDWIVLSAAGWRGPHSPRGPPLA